MSTTGIFVLGLFARSIVKSGGEFLLRKGLGLDDVALNELLKKELLSNTTKELPGPVEGVIGRLSLKNSSREKLLRSGSVLDLAGVAWADMLMEQPDEEVERYTAEPKARNLARRLDPYWFVDVLMSPRGGDFAYGLGSKRPSGEMDREFLEGLSRLVSTAIVDELQLVDGVDPRPLVDRVIEKLPERIYKLWMSLPGIEAQVTRLNTEATLRIVDGSVAREDAEQALYALALSLVGLRDEDVFGRTSSQPDELPLLSLKSTYVEPEAVLRQARVVKDEKAGERGAAKDLVRIAWAKKPASRLVVLHAPFGFGKSLTFKSLAADLAEEWLSNREDAPFPVLLKCPDILSGHVSTLKAAVLSSLEKLSNLAPAAVEQIWSNRRLVLLLDSFDEVHMSEKEAHSWFEEMQQIVNGNRVRVLVASRPHAFRTKWLEHSDWEIEIQPFDESRAQKWLDATAGHVGPKGLTFREVSSRLDAALAGTPILLVMAAYGWNENQSEDVNSKAAIYRRFIEKISTGKWADIQVAHRVVSQGIDTLEEIAGANAFQEALRVLAWEYLCVEQRSVQEGEFGGLSRKHVGDILEARFEGVSEEAVTVVTRSLCLSLFFRKAIGSEAVVFTHRSFREFLCATYVVNVLKNELVQSHYLSSAWLTMTQAELGEGELAFLGELLQELSESERARIVGQLDAWCRERREIFFKGKGGLQIEKAGAEVEIGLVEQQSDRSGVFALNVEKLSLIARRVSMPAVLKGRVGRLWRYGRYKLPLLGDDVYRLLLHMGGVDELRGIGYCVETGQLALVVPRTELATYREMHARQPDLLMSVVHVSGNYFAVSESGLRIDFVVKGIVSFDRMREFLSYGEFLRDCEARGIRLTTAHPYGRIFKADRGWVAGFCSPFSARSHSSRDWWAKRALDLLVHHVEECVPPEARTMDQARGTPSGGFSEFFDDAKEMISVLAFSQLYKWEDVLRAYSNVLHSYAGMLEVLKDLLDESEEDGFETV